SRFPVTHEYRNSSTGELPFCIPSPSTRPWLHSGKSHKTIRIVRWLIGELPPPSAGGLGQMKRNANEDGMRSKSQDRCTQQPPANGTISPLRLRSTLIRRKRKTSGATDT